jgi:hypothetical protein
MKDGSTVDSMAVSYKQSGINTYNLFVIDLETRWIKYRHESSLLWESNCNSLLLESNEFLLLSKDGIVVMAIGEKPMRTIIDNAGDLRMIHSLGELNYLKIEPSNHIFYSFNMQDDRQIKICEQYKTNLGATILESIYSLKISDVTLRQLMMIQSFYALKSNS